MPFLDHLEELRWRLIKSVAAIIVGGMVAFLFTEDFDVYKRKHTKYIE